MTTKNQKEGARYWGIRLGEGGKFVEHGRKGKYIAIGWGKLGNLAWLSGKEKGRSEVRDELTQRYKDIWGGSEIAIGIKCGEIWSFVREMKEGDIVAIPDMAKGRVLIGKVVGPYEYKDDWGDDCPFPNRRSVEWISQEIKRDIIPPKLKTSLGSLLAVFSLDRRKQEIMTLIGLPPPPGTGKGMVTGPELVQAVIERLFNLTPEKFEHFVKHLMTLVGFEATTTKLVGDKGVDVIGTLSPEGLAIINLKAQVKRVKGNTGNQDILMLRGTLAPDEHGVFITTGGFTKQAREEAEAEGKKPIVLIDGRMLVDLILNHYDELDKEYKEPLQLRKREIPITERFYMIR